MNLKEKAWFDAAIYGAANTKQKAFVPRLKKQEKVNDDIMVFDCDNRFDPEATERAIKGLYLVLHEKCKYAKGLDGRIGFKMLKGKGTVRVLFTYAGMPNEDLCQASAEVALSVGAQGDIMVYIDDSTLKGSKEGQRTLRQQVTKYVAYQTHDSLQEVWEQHQAARMAARA